MKQEAIKTFFLLTSLTLSLFSCKQGPESSKPEVNLDPNDFKSGKQFITVADLPPNPLDDNAVSTYKDLGLNTCLMTEDFVAFAKDGGLNPEYKSAVKNLGDHGLDVWIRNQYNDEDYFQNDNAEKIRSNYGTPYSLSERNVTDEFQDLECVKGFYMADEPYMTKEIADLDVDDEKYKGTYESMDRYQKLVDWKNTYYPDAYWHLNQVPSSSTNHFVGDNYETFLQYYVDNILKKLTSGPRTLSLDRYPLDGEETLDQGYFSDLLLAANVNKKYNDSASDDAKSTFCICLQTFMNIVPSAHLVDITIPEELTFQLYSAYAVGAQALEYFCYRSISSFGFFGIVDDDGEKRIYDTIKEGNERGLWMQDVLLDFSWQGAFTVSASEESMRKNEACFDACSPYELKTTDRGVLTNIDSRLDTVVGYYTKGDQPGYMVANYTNPLLEQTDIVTMDFKDCQKAIVYQNKESKVVDLVNGQLRLKLEKGDGAFIIPR